jgi:phage major head subunit gpT-like protein
MALTKSDVPELLLPGLKTEFELAYRSEVEDSLAEKLATVINTTLPSQTYAWLGAAPPMREFVDERRPSGLASNSVTIDDKVFESTIAVDRRAIEDDQLDLIRLRVRDLASRVSAHRHQLVVDALNAGDSATAYDGASFFDTSHPNPAGSAISNTTTDALSATSLADAITAMMTFPDDTGTPLGIVPDTLLVGPKQMWNAIELVESSVVVYKATAATGTSPTDYINAFKNRLQVVVSPYIDGTYDDNWYLLDSKRPIKAVILQQREDVPVEFSALEAESGSESAWMRDRFHYGVRARYNTGYGLWQAAYAGVVA